MSKAIKTLTVAFAAAAVAAPLAQADATKAPRDAFRAGDVQRLRDVQRPRDVQRLHDAFRLRDVQRLEGAYRVLGLPWDGLRAAF